MALLVSFLICFAWLGIAVAAPRGAAVDRSKEVAQKVYAQGVDHYRAGRMLEALAAFRASYQMVPSPNSHLMIARTMRDHGDLVDAYVEYGKVIVEADAGAERDAKYASTSQASRAERAKLRTRLTMITVDVKQPPDDLRIVIGERVIDKDSWGSPVPVLPGALVARATSNGRPEQRQQVVAVPGGELAVSFDFAALAREPRPSSSAGDEAVAVRGDPSPFPPGPTPGGDAIPDIPRQPPRLPAPAPDRTWAYVSFGVAGAGLATFVTFAAINQATFNSLQDSCHGGHCPPTLAEDIDKGRRAQTIANVGFGVALAGATLGAILLVTGSATESKTEELARRPGKIAVTDLSIGPHAVKVGGVF
jgi:hypothetical protein